MARSPMRVTRSSSPLAESFGTAARRALLNWGVVRGRRSPWVAVSSSSEGSPPQVRRGRGHPRGRGRGRGRGHGSRSEAPQPDAQPLPPPPLPTPVHRGPYADLHGFEFIVQLPDKPLGPRLHMSEKLSRALSGRRPRFLEMHMVGSDAAWMVEAIFDSAGHMTLREAWRDFIEACGVQPGYLLVFEFLGDGALVGKMFNTHLCRK